jgi:hypothetical protein
LCFVSSMTKRWSFIPPNNIHHILD